MHSLPSCTSRASAVSPGSYCRPEHIGHGDIGSAGAAGHTGLGRGFAQRFGQRRALYWQSSTGFDNTSATYSGAISGIGGVNKWGTGTQTLAAAILHGDNVDNGGVLSFASSSALGSGNFNLSGGSMQTPAGVGACPVTSPSPGRAAF